MSLHDRRAFVMFIDHGAKYFPSFPPFESARIHPFFDWDNLIGPFRSGLS